MIWTFHVPGPAIPYQRPASGAHGGRFTSPKARSYRKRVAWAAHVSKPAGWPMDARYSLVVDVTPRDGRIGDWDNYGKEVSDALNKIAWDDDRQVKDGRVRVLEPNKLAPGIVVTLAVL